jgi:hypothetical protein
MAANRSVGVLELTEHQLQMWLHLLAQLQGQLPDGTCGFVAHTGAQSSAQNLHEQTHQEEPNTSLYLASQTKPLTYTGSDVMGGWCSFPRMA